MPRERGKVRPLLGRNFDEWEQRHADAQFFSKHIDNVYRSK